VYVSILFVRILLSELRSRDLSGSALLAGTSVDEATLTDLRATISTEQWVTLLLRGLEITGDPALGLALGESSPSMLQVVGQLIASCRTLRESLEVMQRYHTLLSNNTVWTLEEHDDKAILYCNDGITQWLARRVSLEATLALGYRIGRTLVAQGSDEVWFEYEEPPHVAQYARVFACPVRFNQPRNALIFARSLLDMAQPHGDDTTRAVLLAGADTLLRERESERLAERVRAMLRYEHDFAQINVHRVAERLSVNVRALRRRLNIEGSSVADLLNEARLRIAQQELSKPEATIKEVAHSLGFSETSAFHRAFKRWSGRAPAQFMKELVPAKATSASKPPDA
jgi:AraC-like DNA-binding protein